MRSERHIERSPGRWWRVPGLPRVFCPNDETGALNLTDESRRRALERVAGGKVYDVAVELFVGMPACCTVFGRCGRFALPVRR